MQILKRLALSVPALLIISSAIFFLSKLMPGTAGDSFLEDESLLVAPAQVDTKEKIYRQYLKRTGQDKPLFYISVASLAEPDTLYKIYPENHQQFLKKLCFTYGNWEVIANYYKSLLEFQEHAQAGLANPGQRLSLLVQIEKLLRTTRQSQVKAVIQDTDQLLQENGYSDNIGKSFEAVQINFIFLISQQQQYSRLIPVIHWNGFENQYHQWLSGLFKGDLGTSMRGNRPVAQIIGEALSITLIMTSCSLFFGWMISLFLGLLINLPLFKEWERPILNSLYFLDTLPLFLLAFFLLILLSGGDFFGILPTFGLGNYQLEENIFARFFILFNHLTLPIFCMTLVILPYLTGQIDRSLKEVEKLVFITTAKAKGLNDFQVLIKHVLKNAWTPLITIFTEQLPALFSGALVVEVIFAIPGMGRLLADAVSARDYPVILGIIIIVAMVKIVSNILADVLYAWVDPRVKLNTDSNDV